MVLLKLLVGEEELSELVDEDEELSELVAEDEELSELLVGSNELVVLLKELVGSEELEELLEDELSLEELLDENSLEELLDESEELLDVSEELVDDDRLEELVMVLVEKVVELADEDVKEVLGGRSSMIDCRYGATAKSCTFWLGTVSKATHRLIAHLRRCEIQYQL